MKKLDELKDKEILMGWREKAEGIKYKEDLNVFIDSLLKDYEHDYGTIVYAMEAAMMATMSIMNKSSQGGITGTQAAYLGQMLVGNLFSIECFKIVDYGKLLYPQYENDLKREISARAWNWVQEKAKENLSYGGGHPKVVEHWKSIADGKVPFGFTVAKEEEEQ